MMAHGKAAIRMKTKFLIFTDLHVDIMHDTPARMEIILNAAKAHGVDFLLHLGDIMYPEEAFVRECDADGYQQREESWFLCDRDDEKTAIRQMIAQSGLPLYGVLGNHDMDACTKPTACRYWNMPASFYTFVMGGVRFVALDSQYIRTENGYVDFSYNNYKHYKAPDLHLLPPDQLRWLEETLMASAEPCVLLSHASLADDLLCIRNKEAVWEIIARANADKRRVIAAFNGHNHVDGLTVRQGVPFISINSASNIWIGAPYQTIRYSQTLSRLYPHMQCCAPYFDPLYTVVTIDENGILMEGTQSSFVGPSPQELGFPESGSFHDPCACIRSRKLPLAFIEGDGKTDRFDL